MKTDLKNYFKKFHVSFMITLNCIWHLSHFEKEERTRKEEKESSLT